jgi:DtxR family Mn-dependent transcriptional regulator
MGDLWKAFEQNPISHSAAHHLLAIHALRQSQGYARVSDVARELNITRGSASLTLKALKQRGLVAEDPNRFLLLSEQGQRIADAVRSKHSVVRRFLEAVLGVQAPEAAADTCKIEHLISDATSGRLARFVELFQSDEEQARAFRRAWARAVQGQGDANDRRVAQTPDQHQPS